MEPLKVKVILGSIRQGRFSEHSAIWIMDMLKSKQGIAAELVDLKDHVLPPFEDSVTPGQKQGVYADAQVAAWAAKIADADAFIFVTPEYNRNIPGTLKNTIDHIYFEFNKKPLGIVTHGSAGGARAAESLRTTGIELQMAPVRQAVHILSPWTLVDEKGALKPGSLDQYARAADTMIEQLTWWGKALRTARSQ